MEDCDTPTYLAHVEQRLGEEARRVVHYLDQSSKSALVRVLEEEMITRHTQGILEHGFHMLLDGQRLEDLRRLHRLFRRVGATEEVYWLAWLLCFVLMCLAFASHL